MEVDCLAVERIVGEAPPVEQHERRAAAQTAQVGARQTGPDRLADAERGIDAIDVGRHARQQLLGFLATNSKLIYGPALIAAGAFGILLIVVSDEAWEFSQGWVSFAFLVWIAMNGVLHALLLPAERKLADGDEASRSRADLGGQIITVLFIVMLWLMIWKPGA